MKSSELLVQLPGWAGATRHEKRGFLTPAQPKQMVSTAETGLSEHSLLGQCGAFHFMTVTGKV